MENIWRILCCKIYENRKQYTGVNDLKTAIDIALYEISPAVIQMWCLINSMEQHLFDAIQLNIKSKFLVTFINVKPKTLTGVYLFGTIHWYII